MTITNPDDVGLSLAHDATDAARQDLSALSLGAVAPESYPGKLRSQDRLIDIVNAAFDKGAWPRPRPSLGRYAPTSTRSAAARKAISSPPPAWVARHARSRPFPDRWAQPTSWSSPA